jgi:hypothetical protein
MIREKQSTRDSDRGKTNKQSRQAVKHVDRERYEIKDHVENSIIRKILK